MATWIVHLRLAERLLALIDDLDEMPFVVGSVAPDSGIPDEKWETFDPPAELLHFQGQGSEIHQCADLEFYRRHLEPMGQRGIERTEFSFLVGYFLHLVTDNLWRDEIGLPTKERFSEDLEADPRFGWKVKHDWYGLDFEHVRGNPDSIFWRVFLNSSYDLDFLDFLPHEAVQQRLDYIKELYQRTDAKTVQWIKNRPGLYLTAEAMDRFVDDGTHQLLRTYRYLVDGSRDTTGLTSILELDAGRAAS